MSVIRITKYFSFEAAHILKNYEGPCRNIHGHSYRLAVTVKGIPEKASDSPTAGMVMDFSKLKGIVKDSIVDVFDHALILNERDFKAQSEEIEKVSGKVIWVNYQPTCENMLIDFADKLMKLLPAHMELFSLKLHETASSYARSLRRSHLARPSSRRSRPIQPPAATACRPGLFRAHQKRAARRQLVSRQRCAGVQPWQRDAFLGRQKLECRQPTVFPGAV